MLIAIYSQRKRVTIGLTGESFLPACSSYSKQGTGSMSVLPLALVRFGYSQADS
jgi:hypothetical protein